MVDPNGFRLNIGIILVNEQNQLFWGRRVGQEAWQFPQGGVHQDETLLDALYRELTEEVGLLACDVDVLGCTEGWLYYRLPKCFVRPHVKPLVIGQKQKWYMLKLLSCDSHVCLHSAKKPEFDGWRWVNYWHPLKEIVSFKRSVYRKALQELFPLINVS